jgi:hypothetical protein
MSNLTDFFPAAGGGGTHITNPLELPRYYAYTGRIQMKGTSTGVQVIDIQNDFWTLWNATRDSVDVAVDDTYYTIKDVSSSTNGGWFINAISPTVQEGIITFRITVDGTVYTIEMNNPVYRVGYAGRFSIGSFLYNQQATTSSSTPMQYPNGNLGFTDASYGFLHNGVFAADELGYQTVIIDNIFAGAKLRFESTFKIEVKAANKWTTTTPYNNAGATVVLI